MDQNVIYVGIDVDDERYHGSTLDKRTGEVLDFSMPSDLEGFSKPAQESARVLWWFAVQAVLRSILRGFLAAARPQGSRL